MTGGLDREAPFAWNVTGLLADGPGAQRTEVIDAASIDLGPDLRLARPITGRVRLSRTNRGILAQSELAAALALECSRCLRAVDHPVDIRIDEEYLPSIDVHTGRAVINDEPDVLRLSDHHELDLETPVREALQLAEPIALVCRPDCPGLCTVCGGRLDDGPHDHPDDDIDPRLEALRGFRASDG